MSNFWSPALQSKLGIKPKLGILIALIIAVILMILMCWHFLKPGDDMQAIFRESQRLASGENPYTRILSGNIRSNKKYPTLLPLFYIVGALGQLIGLRKFEDWVVPYQVIFSICHLSISLILFRAFAKRGFFLLGILAFWFFLLNRWSLYVLRGCFLEPLIVLLLVVSVILFKRHNRLSLLCFSLSLAIKQSGILLFPLYLIWIWRSSPPSSAKKNLTRGILIILSVPIFVSLPFLIWNPEGFVQSILFSVTRNPGGRLLSIDGWLKKLDWLDTVMVGTKAKLPTLFLLIILYFSAWKYSINRYVSSFLTFLIFIGFNSVYFEQYTYWVLPFMLLSIQSFLTSRQPDVELVKEDRWFRELSASRPATAQGRIWASHLPCR